MKAEILHQLRLVVYPIIYRVSYIPGGAGFQPSTVPSQFEPCWAVFVFFHSGVVLVVSIQNGEIFSRSFVVGEIIPMDVKGNWKPIFSFETW